MQKLWARCRSYATFNVGVFVVNVVVFVGLWTYAFDRDEDVFRRGVMLSGDRRLFGEMVDSFFVATEAAGVTCLIMYGTLLGSYRNHDLIPWDDDVDIMCSNSQRDQLKKVLLSLAPKYGVHQYPADDLWKFYVTDASHPVSRDKYRWPFIDVVFYVENATHVRSQNTWLRPRFEFARRYVFPLSRRPLAGLRVPAPCDTGLVLRTMFRDLSRCTSRAHSHRLGIGLPRYMTRTVPCSALAGSFPFVHHDVIKGGFVNETLRLGDVTLYSLVLPPCGGSGDRSSKKARRRRDTRESTSRDLTKAHALSVRALHAGNLSTRRHH